jgi:homoserine dehydrogenase
MQDPAITVLKFGSSVLRHERDLGRVVHEIYRWIRKGERVIAVVSAFAGVTDQLIEKSLEFGARPEEQATAALVATGEATAAALLALALDRAGIPAAVLDPAEIGLVTAGGIADAEIAACNGARLLARLDQVPVVVVPGFVGRSSDGQVTLLGRGGSDLTALFLAQHLKTRRCRLIKDVDGLYESDPALDGPPPARYRTVHWKHAQELDGRIVQKKAIHFAEKHRLSFEVAALQSDTPTLVGPAGATFYPERAPSVPIRVGLLGLGTVGLGVYEEVLKHPEYFTVAGVCVRNLSKHMTTVDAKLLTQDAWQVLKRDCDVIVELMGGHHPATALIAAALENGIDVVTANKSILAVDGPMLARVANESGARLLFSAAVGGSVPMLEVLEIRAADAPVRVLSGILNGTSNFILDETGQGTEFEVALAKAQEQGFAEADPKLDLDGSDAAEKLVLLARTASGLDYPSLTLNYKGILEPDWEPGRGNGSRELTAEECNREGGQSQSGGKRAQGDGAAEGHVRRLVARAEISGVRVWATVEPVFVSPDDHFARISREQNCLLVEWADGQKAFLHGKGAGRWPTTEAVFADLLALYRHRRQLSVFSTAPDSISNETSYPSCAS